jgi:hypothetical protein
MPHEPIGSCPPSQGTRSKHCLACGQAKPLTDFPTRVSGGRANSCKGCQRAVSRLAGRRRGAAMCLLIAAHPEEWAGLLGLVRGRRQLGTTQPKGGGGDAA